MIHQALGRLPKDVAILIIEHDMDVVFRFAQEIVVLVQGLNSDPVRLGGFADPRVRAALSARRRPNMTELRHQGPRSGRRLGADRRLDGISLAVPAGGTLAVLGRDGAGKTTCSRR